MVCLGQQAGAAPAAKRPANSNDVAKAGVSGDSSTPTAAQHELKLLDVIGRFDAPAVDVAQVSAEDAEREAAGLPPRFAIPNATLLNTGNSGTWEQLDDQTSVWRLVIASPGATSLNLGFGRFRMPTRARLMIYASDLSEIIRSFNHRDNAAHGELWTPVIRSEEIVVELTIANRDLNELVLDLTQVNVGYRGFGTPSPIAMSGSCNVDVVCPEGDPWALEIKSVAVISTGGSTFCSGFMVNNTALDLKPYFMTADHCGIYSGNAASLVTYWNYENSWCRPPFSPESGGSGDGLLNQFNSGSYWRASYGPSDMTLVELDSDPDPAWDVAYAGWDRSANDPVMAIAIHHPNTDEKRISFEYDPTTTTSYLSSAVPGNGTHIRVEDWDVGTTEGGSSGSPLFDQNHRVTGQLHGGYASCSSQTADWYGRFSVSWNGGGSSSSRLSDWLDPGNSGAMTLDTISLLTMCSSAGEISFDQANYGCEDAATIEVVDCDLNLDEASIDTAQATVTSDTDPTGITVTLTETKANSARFEGTFVVSTTAGSDELQVAAGDFVVASYFDEDDGTESSNNVTAQARIDCTPPEILDVSVINLEPRSATIGLATNEPSGGAVHYGLACTDLVQTASDAGLSENPQVDLTGLEDDTTYFYAVEAIDEAGNVASDDNGGSCYTFTTPAAPNFFTEEFGGDNDLDETSLIFTPVGGEDHYDGCTEAITSLPTAPTGSVINFSPNSDDGYAFITLVGGATIDFYGVSYSTFFVGSNGYITFGNSDTDYTETLSDHFDIPRISALFDDLDPSSGGVVRWEQYEDRAVVSFLSVPEYGESSGNTFQFELYFDGNIVVSYDNVAAADGIAGLSEGNGYDSEFYETDLSAISACVPPDCNENGTPDAEDIQSGTSEDCNGSSTPDECDIADATSPDTDDNGVPDECQLLAPLAVSAGCRCISVTPQPMDGTLPVALGITGNANDPAVACLAAFMQDDGTMGAEPVYKLPAEWGTVDIVGEEIRPGTTYEFQSWLETGHVSSSQTVDTWMWADVDHNDVANFVDIQLIAHGFQGIFVNTTLEAVDIWPCTPDQVVNFEDVLQGVRAFQGHTFEGESCSELCP
jgi:hypothetical protein